MFHFFYIYRSTSNNSGCMKHNFCLFLKCELAEFNFCKNNNNNTQKKTTTTLCIGLTITNSIEKNVDVQLNNIAFLHLIVIKFYFKNFLVHFMSAIKTKMFLNVLSWWRLGHCTLKTYNKQNTYIKT